MPALVELQRNQNQIATLRIQRPEVRNALSWKAMDQFAQAVKTAAEDKQLRVLIVTGGPQAFCAGGDLHELHRHPSHTDGARLTKVMGEALEALSLLPFPTIAAVEGPAMGGGAEIALACDMRVVAANVKFGLMHIRLGIASAWGGGPRLASAVGYARALEWQTKGVVLNGEEVFAHGLANALVDDGDTLETAYQMAHEISMRDPAAVRAIKKTLLSTVMEGTKKGMDYERKVFPSLWTGSAHLEAAHIFVKNRKKKS
jgi:enoyl-CoA hydratase/carnithine racemase